MLHDRRRLIIVILFVGLIIHDTLSLECHSCMQMNTNKGCNENVQTCADGEICYTEVRRVPIYNKLYTKGCMAISLCYSLQNLNDRGTCQEEPSVCTYCCLDNHCNAFNSGSRLRTLPLVPLTSTFSVLFCILSWQNDP